MLRDRTLTEWRLKLEDLADSMESEAREIEDLSAQAELELLCDKMRMMLCDLESFQQDHVG